jgi:hypothetical protein
VTEAVALDGDATIVFFHWMEAETSGSYPGYAYDGGLVEVSLDGAPWTQLTPVGGYPYLAREGSNPGPFPQDTPIYSGAFDWSAARIELVDMHGNAQFRFRFGSDGSQGMEGWFIDDIEIIGSEPPASSAAEGNGRPAVALLCQNTPNPFGGRGGATQIGFALPAEDRVTLQVVDAGGRLVRTLVAGQMPAGWHRITWDGCDADARAVGSGVYFYVLTAGGREQARRMLVLR